VVWDSGGHRLGTGRGDIPASSPKGIRDKEEFYRAVILEPHIVKYFRFMSCRIWLGGRKDITMKYEDYNIVHINPEPEGLRGRIQNGYFR
jgi:hypothetical protein